MSPQQPCNMSHEHTAAAKHFMKKVFCTYFLFSINILRENVGNWRVVYLSASAIMIADILHQNQEPPAVSNLYSILNSVICNSLDNFLFNIIYNILYKITNSLFCSKLSNFLSTILCTTSSKKSSTQTIF
jgi:hypothetical protein